MLSCPSIPQCLKKKSKATTSTILQYHVPLSEQNYSWSSRTVIEVGSISHLTQLLGLANMCIHAIFPFSVTGIPCFSGMLYCLLSHPSMFSILTPAFFTALFYIYIHFCLQSATRADLLIQMPVWVAEHCKNLQHNNGSKFEKNIFQSRFGIKKAVLFYKIVY